MSEPIKLAAFCGSLRKASFNRMALHAFIERLPAGVTAETIEIGDWPLYDADLQAKGFPRQGAGRSEDAAGGRRHRVRKSGIQLFDFGRAEERHRLAVAHDAATLRAKPIALFGASGGPLGTARAQYHLRQMMVFLDGRPVNKPEVMIGAAQTKFVDGKFTDEVGAKLLADLGAALALAVCQAKAAASVK